MREHGGEVYVFIPRSYVVGGFVAGDDREDDYYVETDFLQAQC